MTALLGVPHKWAANNWLCGPVSGLVVQPPVGYYSDRSRSRFGCHRPFIVYGIIAVAMAALLIGYATDLGHTLGDDLDKKTKPHTVVIFVLGFSILDVANNLLQGLCQTFIVNLVVGDQRRVRIGNNFFSFFMEVGNVIGYYVGSSKSLYKTLPFTETESCGASFLANLKTSFFFSTLLLIVLSTFVLLYVEDPYHLNHN